MSLPQFTAQFPMFSVEQFLHQQFDTADPFRLFADRIYPLLANARPALAQAYCADNGRPGIEPVLLLGVSVLQYIYRLPDRAAVEMFKYHLGWKLALHCELDLKVFDASALSYFRRRLVENDLAKAAFDAVLGGLVEQGLVKRAQKQRLDSTHVLGLVAKLSASERLRETLRLALGEVAAVPGLERPEFWGTLWERYVQNKLDWRLEEKQLAQKLAEAGADMALLLEWAKRQQPALMELAGMRLLERVLEENFEKKEGTLEVQDQPAGAVVNPHDPDAQWASKGKGKEWVGYKVQVAETVNDEPLAESEPTRSFVTAMATQEATGSDEAGLEQVRAEQAESGMEPAGTLLVDGAYVSGEVLKQEAEAGRELIGPAQEPPTKGPGFKSDAFDVRVEERTATCPAGRSSSACSRLDEQARGKVNFRFEWGAQCRACELAPQCVGKNQTHRTLLVGEHHTHVQERRREQKTEAFEKKMRQRNAIEGTQSELVRGHGLRRARYRGLPKVRLQNYLIGAACNAKRWIAHLAWEIRQGARSLAGGAPAAAA